MQIDYDTFYQIAFSYKKHIIENNIKLKEIATEEANTILKILGIRVLKDSNNQLFLKYKKEELYLNQIFFKKVIHPADLGIMDIKAIEATLNDVKYLSTSILMGPLFDCIGWVLNNSSGKWKINFIGGPTYNLWIDPIEDEVLSIKEDGWIEEKLILSSEEKEWWKA